MRADDVKYSFERQLRQNEAGAAWVFRPLVGAAEFISGEADTIAGIQIASDQIVKVELIQPVAFFLSTICMDYGYIVPREEVERSPVDFGVRPVGSGPFRVIEPVLGKQVQMERFANYWDPELPYVDKLTVTFGVGAEEIFDGFLQEDLDFVNDLPLTDLADLKRRAGQFHFLEAMQLQTRMLVFDCERPPFSDKRVRQAICHALDRNRFLSEVYGNMAEAAIGPIPPGLVGYDPSYLVYDHDPERARSLLEEAGYTGGFDTETWWPQSVSSAVECLKDDLAEIGVRAEFHYSGPEEMQRALRLRIVPMAGRDWFADYPDPDNFTYVLFHSRNRDLFIGTYSNEDLDRLTDQARSVMDRDVRAEIYREVTRLLLEDAPCAFLAHRRKLCRAQART